VRRVARTLCDLRGGGAPVISDQFVSLALNLRVDPYEQVRRAA
jgi:hypothetical protein